MKAVLSFALLLILAGNAMAGEERVQPVLLPMPELLRQLDAKEEWILLPLDEWRALRAVDPAKAADPLKPQGAWIEGGRVRGELMDDSELRLTGELTIVSVDPAPTRVRLFPARPARLGQAELAGAPALLVPGDQGVDLLVPGPGRHALILAWQGRLVGTAERKGDVVLPLAGGLDLHVISHTPGQLAGPGLAADGDGWRLARPAEARLPLTWHPGRLTEVESGALAVRQAVAIHLDAAGAATLRWSARLEALHGALPGRLTLRLPAGWRFTTPGAGVRRITGDDVVELDLGADARVITCDGIAAAGVGIALPAIDGALTAPGIVLLTADRAWDDTLPPGWRVEAAEPVETDKSSVAKPPAAVWSRRYAAPGPGGVLTLTPAQDGALVEARSAANLLIGPGVGDWTIEQGLEVDIPPAAVREVPLQLPAGWALTTLTTGPGVTVVEVAEGEVSDLPPGVRLTLRLTGYPSARLKLDLTRRDAAAPAALVQVVGARRVSQRLRIHAAPPLATVISAAAPWRLIGGDDQVLRAELLATGEAPAIPVIVSERPSACTAEAVVWLLPASDGGWCRLDLRLTVRDGDLDGLTLVAPFAGEAPRCTSALMTCEKRGDALALGSRSRWRGEHLLRLEGRLQAGGKFPRLTLTLPDGATVPLRVTVALQSSGDADLVAAPGPAGRTVDEDELPTWTRPIPGAPVLGAWRIQGDGEAGSWTLVERAAAALPPGVIDALELRTQFDATGMRTVLTARIAAPGLQALPLILSPGWSLEDAAIDGAPVAVRITPNGVVLPLPGRTQVRVALALRYPAHRASVDIPLPRLGELPVTRSAWHVALPADWRVIPSRDPGAMPLVASTLISHRPWFGSWLPAGTSVDVPALLPPVSSGSTDERALVSGAATVPRLSEPGIALRGQLWTGMRTGAPERLALNFAGIDQLAAWDRIGRLLAALIAIAVVALGHWRVVVALALMAWPLAAALHAWQVTAGPLLALSEWVPLAMAGAATLRGLIKFMRRPALVTALLAVAVGVGGMGSSHAGESPVLMGYDHIDAAGLPQVVRVALTRAQLTMLWQRAHPEAVTTAPACALATGVPRVALTLAVAGLTGELRLPFAVLSKDWQTVRLPALAASARSVTLAGLAGAPVPAGALAWRADGGDLVLSLAGGTQAEVVVALALPLTQSAGSWTATLMLPPGLGGRVSLSAPSTEARRPVLADGRTQMLDTDKAGWRWSSDIDPASPHWTVELRQPQDAQRHDAGLAAEQQVRAVLEDGRISWFAELALTIRGEARRTLTLDLPANLTLATIAGNGVAGWRQEGASAVVSFTAPVLGAQALTFTGLIPRGVGDGQALLLLRLAGATVAGRLDLTHGADDVFVRPAAGGWERTDPITGSDLAMRVANGVDLPPLTWQPRVAQLTMEIEAAAMVGIDHLRVVAAMKLTGKGVIDSLRLALPAEWRVTAPGLVLSEALSDKTNDAERVITLRHAGPWRAGDVAVLVLERERAGIGARIALPDFAPRRGQLQRERVVWVVGDASDRRVRMVEGATITPRDPLAVAAGLARSGAVLRVGEQWRLAFEQRELAPLALDLVEAESPLRVEASHYLVVGQERVRWWSRLICQPGDGRVSEVRCILPTAAQVVRVQAGGLGSWSRDGDVLLVRLAAPTRLPVTLELDLEQSLSDGRTLIAAPQVAGGIASQRVALVDEDGLGLLHLDPEGLEPDDGVGGLPDGIDAAHITKRWRAVRPAWQVAVRREAVATSIGVDGVATLVDVFSVIAGDGESRARATWHVLNRTKHQLPLVVPAGVELWEARLDGRVVRPRIGDDGRIWLPVRVQRPGEAALRVSLTWRERLALGGGTTPGLPRLDGLRVQRVLWRFAPASSLAIAHNGGDLRSAGAGEAETDRARCVVDELTRLRALSGLNDAGLARLADQLTALDLELDDYQVAMRRLGIDDSALSRAAQAETAAFVGVVDANKAQVQQELKRIGGEVGNRANRRRALGLSNMAQRWQQGEAPAGIADDGYLLGTTPATLPWRPAAAVAAGDTLGVGEPPPGLRAASATGMLGVDLLGDAPPVGLVLRGDGGGMDVRLSLKRTGGSWVPWLGIIGGVLAAAMVFVRLRRE